jgi:hypothetical protein
MVKLYDVPRNTWVKPLDDGEVPPTAKEIRAEEPILFHHIDGMYSYCKDQWGNVVHLKAWQEVEIILDKKD